jgi:hypothetical protein
MADSEALSEIEKAVEAAGDRIDRLLALVEPRYPLVVADGQVSANPWLVVGPSLIARAVSTVRSIRHLSSLQKDADPLSLLRDLLEIVFTFAWLAADPPARIDAWEKADMASRLQVDDDAKRFVHDVLEPGFRADLEAKIVGRPSYPSLLDRAQQADEYWSSRLAEVVGDEAADLFRRLYAVHFRYASGFTHSLPIAVNRLVEEAGGSKVVSLEGTTGTQRGVANAPIAFALMLYVASETLAFPASSDVSAALR